LIGLAQASVLEPLGAVTRGSQFLEPDGIEHISPFSHRFAEIVLLRSALSLSQEDGLSIDMNMGYGEFDQVQFFV